MRLSYLPQPATAQGARVQVASTRAAPCAAPSWRAAGGQRLAAAAAAGEASRQQQTQQLQAQQQQQHVCKQLNSSSPHSPSSSSSRSPTASHVVAAAALPLALLAAGAGPAAAFEIFGEIYTEPANALSLPTWAVHTSSVLEWIVAMGLM